VTATGLQFKIVTRCTMLLVMVAALVESLACVVVPPPDVMELDALALNLPTSKASYLTGIGVRIEEAGFADTAVWGSKASNWVM
jgi:hypothetical protein